MKTVKQTIIEDYAKLSSRSACELLIRWLERNLECPPEANIVTHSHVNLSLLRPTKLFQYRRDILTVTMGSWWCWHEDAGFEITCYYDQIGDTLYVHHIAVYGPETQQYGTMQRMVENYQKYREAEFAQIYGEQHE